MRGAVGCEARLKKSRSAQMASRENSTAQLATGCATSAATAALGAFSHLEDAPASLAESLGDASKNAGRIGIAMTRGASNISSSLVRASVGPGALARGMSFARKAPTPASGARGAHLQVGVVGLHYATLIQRRYRRRLRHIKKVRAAMMQADFGTEAFRTALEELELSHYPNLEVPPSKAFSDARTVLLWKASRPDRTVAVSALIDCGACWVRYLKTLKGTTRFTLMEGASRCTDVRSQTRQKASLWPVCLGLPCAQRAARSLSLSLALARVPACRRWGR